MAHWHDDEMNDKSEILERLKKEVVALAKNFEALAHSEERQADGGKSA